MNVVPIATARAVPGVVLSEHLVQANPRLSVYPALQTEQSGQREESYSTQNRLVGFQGRVDVLELMSAEKCLFQLPTNSYTTGCPFESQRLTMPPM